jgi:hypothetical protein
LRTGASAFSRMKKTSSIKPKFRNWTWDANRAMQIKESTLFFALMILIVFVVLLSE